MRVLLLAYACEPCRGSEMAVGWNTALEMAKHHDIWVLTRTANREAIESASGIPSERLRFLYFDLPRLLRWWKRGPRGVTLYYYLWQIGAYFCALKAHRRIRFEIVHHVTFGTYWRPSFVSLLPIPFVWGPVGGGESAPPGFFRGFSWKGKVFELARDIARFAGELDPFVRATARRAKVSIATTEETARRLRRLGAKHVLIESQFFLQAEELDMLGAIPAAPASGPIRLISMGRHLHWKGFELGIKAFAEYVRSKHAFEAEYWITGDGPERSRLEGLSKQLGVTGLIHFTGKLPSLHDVYARLGQCHVLIHPALHEAFGNVCLEALAAGRPVICLDLGGPARQVTPDTGIKVTAHNRQQVIRDLSAAIQRLVEDPAMRLRMGEQARQRAAHHFDMRQRGNAWTGLYLQCVSAVAESVPAITTRSVPPR